MISGGSTILRTASPFVLFMAFAHLLPIETFGIFAYYYTIGGFLLILLDFGFNIKMMRDIASAPKNVSIITSNASLAKTMLLIPAGIMCFIMYEINLIQSDELSIAGLIFLGLIAYSYTNHFTIPLRAMGHYHIELYYFSITEIIVIAGTLGTLWGLNDFQSALIAFAALRLVSALAGSILHAYKYGFTWPQGRWLVELKENIPFAVHFALGTLYFTIDTAILRYFVSEQDIGLYQASIRFAMAATLPVALTNTVLLPQFIRLLEHLPEFEKQAIKFNRIVLIFGIVAPIIMLLMFDLLVTILFGTKFIEIKTLLIPILCIVGLRYISSIWGILLTVRGKQTLRVTALAITFLIVLIGNYFIAPSYGIWGAAYVMVAAHVALLLLYGYFIRREFGTLFLNGRL